MALALDYLWLGSPSRGIFFHPVPIDTGLLCVVIHAIFVYNQLYGSQCSGR